jgi:hypothetical protein
MTPRNFCQRINCTDFLALILLLLLVAMASCSGAAKPGTEALKPTAGEIRKEIRRGPVCVRITADKEAISIAENVLLTVEAETEDGYEAELPRFGDRLGEFGIRDYREFPSRLTSGGKVFSSKVYTLEPFLSGDYTIAPMQVRFRKKTGGSAGEGGNSTADTPWEHEIRTEEITIKVSSLLEKEQKELSLHPIKGPVGLPAEPPSLLAILAVLGAAVLIAGGASFLFRQRKATNPNAEPPLPAHELAYRQLQAILDERLIEVGEFKLFFSKISDILRSYIEGRFGIHAPRRTTEEFLSDISRNAPFSRDHRVLLVEFLQNCDLVKFAKHLPSQEEVAKAVDSCRAFIDATRLDTEMRREGDTGTRGRGDWARGGSGRGDERNG